MSRATNCLRQGPINNHVRTIEQRIEDVMVKEGVRGRVKLRDTIKRTYIALQVPTLGEFYRVKARVKGFTNLPIEFEERKS